MLTVKTLTCRINSPCRTYGSITTVASTITRPACARTIVLLWMLTVVCRAQETSEKLLQGTFCVVILKEWSTQSLANIYLQTPLNVYHLPSNVL